MLVGFVSMASHRSRATTVALQIVSVLPLAAVHTLGNLLTNVSLGHVAVSFTHTIKARPVPSAGCQLL